MLIFFIVISNAVVIVLTVTVHTSLGDLALMYLTGPVLVHLDTEQI